jgi:hypothetical protein
VRCGTSQVLHLSGHFRCTRWRGWEREKKRAGVLRGPGRYRALSRFWLVRTGAMPYSCKTAREQRGERTEGLAFPIDVVLNMYQAASEQPTKKGGASRSHERCHANY